MSVEQPPIFAVRTKGQVWTPSWVADGMATLLKSRLDGEVLDPAVGPGALVSACNRLVRDKLKITAYEIDAAVLASDHSEVEFKSSDFYKLYLQNYLEHTSGEKFSAIIANPPYLRHHKIPLELKEKCKKITQEVLGISIDARAGLHVYFLVKAISDLKPNGGLVFIVPSDTFEGIFAEKLWTAIATKYRIDGIITMSSEVSAFPGLDTNAVIVAISKSNPELNLLWAKWSGSKSSDFANSVEIGFHGNLPEAEKLGLTCAYVPITEAIRRGFTRSQSEPTVEGIPFINIARVVRGIATGGNDFFVFTKKRIQEVGLRETSFVRTLMRVRDLPESGLTIEDLDQLDQKGRPTFLLSIDHKTEFYPELNEYIKSGEILGLHTKPLVSARKFWYFMEKRKPVPILFAYLGRQHIRFTKVNVDIQPLTCFLCIYPNQDVASDSLVLALNHPATINELTKVGKSYGNGSIKVEPGGLRKLIIPWDAIRDSKIRVPNLDNLKLF